MKRVYPFLLLLFLGSSLPPQKQALFFHKPKVAAGGGSDITTGLVSRWKLDESSGTSAADATGNGNTGTLNAFTSGQWVSGQINNALSFTGSSSQYVNVGTVAGAQGGAVSFGGWFKLTGGFSPDFLQNTAFNTRSWDLFYDHNNEKFGCIIFNTSNVSIVVESAADPAGTTPLTDGKWYHVIVTYDGATVQVYVNGVASGASASFTGNIRNLGGSDSPTFYMGLGASWASESAEYMTGLMDDVRIYSRALSAADVAALYTFTGP